MSLDFTVIDFETANASRSSACSVGAVKVVDGEIVDRFSTLIRPPAGHDEFHPGNMRIHGIRPHNVVSAPEWPEVNEKLARFVGKDVLVAHNVRFDASVLRSMCETYGLKAPSVKTYCTLELSRDVLNLRSYKLSDVTASLGLAAFQHHDALEDSLACARVLIMVAKLTEASSFRDLERARKVGKVPSSRMRELIGEIEPSVSGGTEPAVDSVLSGIAVKTFENETVAFTGELDVLTRDAAKRLLAAHGGKIQGKPTKATTMVVVGDFDRGPFRDGVTYSSSLQRAFDLARKGSGIRIVTEEEFLRQLTLSRTEVVDWLLSSGAGRGSGAFIPGGTGKYQSHLPDYFVEQARELMEADLDLWWWFDESLKHPSGRASGGEACVWCTREIGEHIHRVHRDRHVCGAACSVSLQRTVVRMWEQNGVVHPDRRKVFWL